MNSDPYFNLGLTSGWIGMLDSGIRSSHTLLTGRTSWVRDCINGLIDNCSTAGAGRTLDPSDVYDHGTAVAAIMSGSAAFGDQMRGVTAIPIDSFRVATAEGTTDSSAVVRAFSAALAGGDNVVNCSIDCGNTICSDAANNAFDAGLVVVAAAGNQGDSSNNRIADPASGKKVLAIGALDPSAWTRVSYSSTGPSTFGPTKPDLMAVGGLNVEGPNTLTLASNAGDVATRAGAGTSFASPFATGGAALMRRNLNSNAGQTYAVLLASGMNFSTSPKPSVDNTQGAGRLALPWGANVNWGQVGVTSTQLVDLPINVAAGQSTIDVAIWWPEGSTHNDVDLQLLKPDGTFAASSTASASVWEKLHASATTTGTWTMRVYPYSVTGSQPVYVSFLVR
jgi:hypothetical protein